MNKKRLKKIYIEITNICNLKCEFCIDNTRKKEYMGVENFETILKKVSPYTDYIYLHIKGEPLLHPYLKEILNVALQYNIKVNITTNGTLLPKQCQVLSNNNSVRQLNISLHSIEQNKEMCIDKTKYIDTVVKCANEIVKNNNTYISYRIWDMDNEKNDKTYIMKTLETTYNITNLYDKLIKEHSVELMKNVYINSDNTFQWPSLTHSVISQKGNCYGLKDQIAILVDGTVVPCCLDQQGDIPLGNIFNTEFEKIINSQIATDMLQGFKENKLIHPLCQRCGFRLNKVK